uniref:Retrovirus-related Pol polyprotein from transposon 17.6 n=1 Tax=Cajanus cajan TaxID=3821 RepID=A0A151U7F5_CAJCA|nr:Retrovirus-related Pol polyprotein from transposon 17.6 [Cajanus cajan]
MNDLLRPFLRKFVLVLFNDILVYNKSLTTHLLHLRSILDLLLALKFYAKQCKCLFGLGSVTYIGHIISTKGVTPELKNIKAILKWPVLHSLMAMRGFLSLTGFSK